MDDFETSSLDDAEEGNECHEKEDDEEVEDIDEEIDEDDEEEEDDIVLDEGDWVKVSSGNGDKKSKNKVYAPSKSIGSSSTFTTVKTNGNLIAPQSFTSIVGQSHLQVSKQVSGKQVKVSSSLNSLDSFKDTLAFAGTKDAKKNGNDHGNENSHSDQSPIDLLIPNTLDEEEIMLRKALELSLKETKMMSEVPITETKTTTTTANKQVKVVAGVLNGTSKKSLKAGGLGLGLGKLDAIDDFSDESFIRADSNSNTPVKPNISQQNKLPQSKTTTTTTINHHPPIIVTKQSQAQLKQQQKAAAAAAAAAAANSQASTTTTLASLMQTSIHPKHGHSTAALKPNTVTSFAAVAATNTASKPAPWSKLPSKDQIQQTQIKPNPTSNKINSIISANMAPKVVSSFIQTESSKPFKWNNLRTSESNEKSSENNSFLAKQHLAPPSPNSLNLLAEASLPSSKLNMNDEILLPAIPSTSIAAAASPTVIVDTAHKNISINPSLFDISNKGPILSPMNQFDNLFEDVTNLKLTSSTSASGGIIGPNDLSGMNSGNNPSGLYSLGTIVNNSGNANSAEVLKASGGGGGGIALNEHLIKSNTNEMFNDMMSANNRQVNNDLNAIAKKPIGAERQSFKNSTHSITPPPISLNTSNATQQSYFDSNGEQHKMPIGNNSIQPPPLPIRPSSTSSIPSQQQQKFITNQLPNGLNNNSNNNMIMMMNENSNSINNNNTLNATANSVNAKNKRFGSGNISTNDQMSNNRSTPSPHHQQQVMLNNENRPNANNGILIFFSSVF
jgi:hypothetical protein